MIVVTGATGKLGRLVIEGLLAKIPAGEIVAAVRNPEKARDLAALGVNVRQADYSQPETLSAAFAGADKALLISSNQLGVRIAQHQAVIDAARAAGATLLAYTSILRADTSTLMLAAEHKATETNIRHSGLNFAFLRNGWYLENHTEQLGAAIQHGAILGAAGDGRFASASRADFAAAAVAVLTGSGHENKVYELAGDIPYTLTTLAEEVSAQAGTTVSYNHLPEEAYRSALLGFGLPAEFAEILVDSDLGASKGELDSTSSDLRDLIGRPTVTLADAVSTALKS
ncbi:NAD(P)-dependent oxidoreductase [Capsulimonas corticalis]|uniref:NAD(P)-dependent oxidoreductase n=1 Tax=Capsulimonas corticalis TaxID=2219043 RepID=A0A402CNQ2_9BACT|nr:SDR family oxidoreductase [Capsulimonas corticalis]BDI33316.1 NAD(P)-dependent oxidoreductase [Capsulimonas corticalis]